MESKPKPLVTRAEIVHWMQMAKRAVRFSQATQRFGTTRAGQIMSQMARVGKLVRVSEGLYRLPEDDAATRDERRRKRRVREDVDRAYARIVAQGGEDSRPKKAPARNPSWRSDPEQKARLQADADEAKRRLKGGDS